jgi:NADPH:quinone reductase-like Zn-dependent oxidoreductase
MSRIVRATSYGTPDVLALHEVPVPQAPDGGVVVAVRAAGVNPIDWKLYSGAFHAAEDDQDPDQIDLGLECAGVLTEIGAGVTGLQIGDEVIVYPATAAYADYITAPITSLVPKPVDLEWTHAGSLLLAATTAFHALHAAGVQAGDTVLIHGGAGGVGLIAIQLAAAREATVIATAAERNHGLLRELGATPIVYGPGLADRVHAVAPQGIDAALDLVGTEEALDVSLEFVADPKRIASITGPPRRAQAGIKLIGYGPGQDAGTELRAAAREDLVDRAGSGSLRVIIDATFPLQDAAKAHKLGLAGHPPGKVALLP